MAPAPSMLRRGLSVVVPVRNAARTIGDCLRSLIAVLPAGESEIIVVDNGSTDGTLDIVSGLGVRLLTTTEAGVSGNRNRGADAACFDMLAFVDADCLACPGWFDSVRAGLADPTVGVCGDRYLLPSDAGWLATAWDRAHQSNTPPNAATEYVPGGNLAIRTDTFRRLGGFLTTMETGEDMDLCMRAKAGGWRVVRNAEMRMVHLGEPTTLSALRRRNAWHGRGARLFYASGRLCFATVCTAVFAISALASPLVLAAALYIDRPWLALGAALPLAIPAAYAVRYARDGSVWHAGQLWLAYIAYFIGRAQGLIMARLRPFQTGSAAVAARSAGEGTPEQRFRVEQRR